MQVVDGLPVDLGDELWNLVESGLLGSPVEAVAPVIGQLLEVGLVRRARSRYGCLAPARPAGRVEAAMEVIQLGVADLDLERSECVAVVMPPTLEAIAEEIVPRLLGNLLIMWQTSTRLLQLLAMLQARRDWSGQDLASRLAVSTWTIRTDIERLRALGYPVDATPGVGGGYRIGQGNTMPPADDEEVVAVVAVGLRTTTGSGVTGIEEASLRAPGPARAAHAITAAKSDRRAADSNGEWVPGTGPTVDSEVLGAIRRRYRVSERLRFTYVDHVGNQTQRTAEPERLVAWGRRWYLLAWDVDRNDWRIFRADRITPKTPTGPRSAADTHRR